MNVTASGSGAQNTTLAAANATRILNIANSNNTKETKFETLYSRFLATHGTEMGGIILAMIRNKKNASMTNKNKSYYNGLLKRAAAVPPP